MPDSLTDEQQRAVDEVAAGPRGKLIEPFVPMLRAPELMNRVQRIGEYLRYQSSLPDALRELAILVVARHWNQNYEWGHHAPIARAAGLDPDIVDAVARGAIPDLGPDDVMAVWRMIDELVESHEVSDATFAAAVHWLGETGVVELIVLTGYYTTLAMTMNAARTPVPDDYERLPSLGTRT